jgi:hypothetical protein
LLLPRLKKLTDVQQWAAWAVFTLASAWLVLKVPRARALSRGLGLVFAALVLSFLAFQTLLLWCPPTMPLAIIGIGTALGLLFGRGKPAPPAEKTAPPADEPPPEPTPV